MRRLIEGGLPPAKVAGMVVDSIREDRFWIVTTDEFDAAIRARGDSISGRSNPPLPPTGRA